MIDMRKRIIMMIMGVALIALPATAQTFGAQQAEQPNAVFQSTSTMTGSGSTYSANPTLNSDGTALYEGASYTPAKAPGGPNRVPPTDHSNTPIGDAVLPLLLMAVAFGGYIAIRRKKHAEA